MTSTVPPSGCSRERHFQSDEEETTRLTDILGRGGGGGGTGGGDKRQTECGGPAPD